MDVGGGLGGTLAAILTAFPELRGVVFDLPAVADGAAATLAAAGLAERCRVVQQALHVAALLGLADLLVAGPMDADSLAEKTEADPTSLLRLLRTLASVGVFEEETEGSFALTPLGATLRVDAPGSVRDRALYYGSPAMWGVWGGLLHSVQTGELACGHVHGASFYEHLLRYPEVGDHSTGT